MVLIDMEYSGVNYPAFDVGTFFCEFAGDALLAKMIEYSL